MLDLERLAQAVASGLGDDYSHAHDSKSHWIETGGESGGRYRDVNEPRKPDYEDAVKAILADIAAQGYVVVPRVPTADMQAAGMEPWAETDDADQATWTIYNAMIHAAEDGG